MNDKMNWLVNMKIAHRGFHSEHIAPENSLKAFKKAIDEGFAIELDVHLLKDGNIAVFHDDNLKRMTGYKKKIEECTYNEINSLNLLDTTEKIPLFSEVLTLVDGKVPLLIELKNNDKPGSLEQKMFDMLIEYAGDFAIQSFNPYSVGWFKENAPNIIRGQLSGSFINENLVFYKKFILRNFLLNHISRPDFINYEISHLSDHAVKKQKNKNMLVLGWTARSEEVYKKALEQCDNVVFEGFNPKNIC